MNSDPNQLHELLDDVMPTSSGHCGPNRASLLAMVQRECSRRRQVRAASAGAALSLLAIVMMWSSESPNESAVVKTPPPMKIHVVNDEQLMALLQDTPAALMEWPDGRRTLLVVAH